MFEQREINEDADVEEAHSSETWIGFASLSWSAVTGRYKYEDPDIDRKVMD